MFNRHLIHRAIDHLRRPFIQRLLIMIISMLLAVSLASAMIATTLPTSGCEVAWSFSSSSPLFIPCQEGAQWQYLIANTRETVSVDPTAERSHT